MLKIAACIFASALFSFLTILFWNLAAETDNAILFALFVTLTIVFLFCAVVSCAACICALLAIGGVDNG